MIDVPPLAILAIGIVTVVGMIIVLRINAFIALITAAMAVSLLAPGPTAEKISRVAQAFGTSAGQIGIVIALAAVIGKCMMDSGAADRVVRTFLALLGEKRASFALMGSGFVLAVPVFFDTVFYLLVPLARSLFRRTGRNYLMFLLAIGAGGAITHTLVPPTPGPLLVAANLNIDLGVMILVGGLVALPAALSGIAFATIADRLSPVPMRPLGNLPEPEPLDDSRLPSLFMSVLPVVLPVLMISTNTVLTTLADNEHAARLSVNDVRDWETLQAELASADTPATPAGRILDQLPGHVVDALFSKDVELSLERRQQFVEALNRLLADQDFYDPEAFAEVLLPRHAIESRLAAEEEAPRPAAEAELLDRMLSLHSLLAQDRHRMNRAEIERLNRLLLEVSFPEAIVPHVWETPRREAANLSSLFGNANLALLLSTAVALFVLYRQRRPPLTEMAKTVETSLMSGGAIILITAGGGAFGAMLQQAEIGDAIQGLFAGGGGTGGLTYLFLAFGVASLLKIAQGSGTVAMITASAMLAAMIDRPDSLGYHPVYIATAIGAGSMVGSWMNDSGFWIFARMGGLTEVEALKSWTVLLVVLGVVSMTVTVLLALTLPLVTAA